MGSERKAARFWLGFGASDSGAARLDHWAEPTGEGESKLYNKEFVMDRVGAGWGGPLARLLTAIPRETTTEHSGVPKKVAEGGRAHAFGLQAGTFFLGSEPRGKVISGHRSRMSRFDEPLDPAVLPVPEVE
jgi:hypothetical protein